MLSIWLRGLGVSQTCDKAWCEKKKKDPSLTRPVWEIANLNVHYKQTFCFPSHWYWQTLDQYGVNTAPWDPLRRGGLTQPCVRGSCSCWLTVFQLRWRDANLCFVCHKESVYLRVVLLSNKRSAITGLYCQCCLCLCRLALFWWQQQVAYVNKTGWLQTAVALRYREPLSWKQNVTKYKVKIKQAKSKHKTWKPLNQHKKNKSKEK